MWSTDEIKRVCAVLYKQLDVPYAIGFQGKDGWVVRGKPSLSEKEPDEFDCSGLSRWIIGQGRGSDGKIITMPHGCIEQLKFCLPLATNPRPLDLGFAALHGNEPDHVVIVYDDLTVIEARGKQSGKEYGKVIRRPKLAWENQKGFMGWWSCPGVNTNRKEGVC